MAPLICQGNYWSSQRNPEQDPSIHKDPHWKDCNNRSWWNWNYCRSIRKFKRKRRNSTRSTKTYLCRKATRESQHGENLYGANPFGENQFIQNQFGESQFMLNQHQVRCWRHSSWCLLYKLRNVQLEYRAQEMEL